MSEQDITRAIIAAVNATGLAEVWRNQSGTVRVKGGYMHHAHAGVADVVGFAARSGLMVAIEVKKPGEVPTQAQTAFLERLRRAGGVAACVTSVAEALAALGVPQGNASNRPARSVRLPQDAERRQNEAGWRSGSAAGS